MEIPEFYFGILLTVIGVIVAGYFAQVWRDRSERDKIMVSLAIEVAENIDIAEMNLEKRKAGTSKERLNFIPFSLMAYNQFSLSLSTKLMQELGDEAAKPLYIGYQECERFNRVFLTAPPLARNIVDKCCNNIKTIFKKFLSIRNLLNYIDTT